MSREPIGGPCLYPGAYRCGTYNAYTNHHCRGDACREASRIYTQKRRNPEIVNQVDDPFSLIRQLARAGDWVDDAACRGLDPNIFFPGQGEPAGAAKAICAICPVTEPCLDLALKNNERHGIWGGLADKERLALKRNAAA